MPFLLFVPFVAFGVIFLIARFDRERPSKGALFIGIAPLCVVAVLTDINLRTSAPPESIVIIGPMALVIGLAAAFILARGWRTICNVGVPTVACVAGSLAGAGFSLVHFYQLRQSNTFGNEGWWTLWIVFCADLLVGATIWSWAAAKDKRRHALVWFGLASPMIFAGILAVPKVAYRLNSFGKPVGGLSRAGAEAVARDDGYGGRSAQRDLARVGDAQNFSVILERVRNGEFDASPPSDLDAILAVSGREGEVADAAFSGLQKISSSYHPDNSFDETDRRLVALLEYFGKHPRAEVLPIAYRLFKADPENGNLRTATAKAIRGMKGSAEADSLAATAIASLIPGLANDVAKTLSATGPKALNAYGQYITLVQNQRIRSAAEKAQVSDLQRAGDLNGLALKVQRGSPKDRVAALRALMLARYPGRDRLVLESVVPLALSAAELRGVQDPELANALVKHWDRSQMTLAVFLCNWSPPEARELMGRLLQMNLRQAAVGLSKLGGSRSTELLTKRLESLPPNEGAVYIDLIVALAGLGDPAAAPALRKLAARDDAQPVLVSDGVPIHVSDAAKYALIDVGAAPAGSAGTRLTPSQWAHLKDTMLR